MRTLTLLVLVLGTLTMGCGSKKPKAKEPLVTETKRASTEDLLTPEEGGNTPVSPNVSVSADLAKLCSLKANKEVPPTFDYDKAELAPEDKAVLEQVATCITTGPLKGRGLVLTGRADPRGTDEYNLGLGERRAQAVSGYLKRLGVNAPQLTETTRGAIEATGTDEAGWQKDRRVDLDLRD